MDTFFHSKRNSFSPSLLRKLAALLLCALACFGALLPLSACSKKVDYFAYVSELRDNIFLAEADGFSLRIFSLTKETPYATDGVPHETTTRTEVYLVAPEGSERCELTFTVGGKQYGGEMSFDNVKAEYYFSCTLNVSAESEITCIIKHGERELTFQARSVRSAQTLSPREILKALESKEQEIFKAMTDKYGFAGEIYLRLIYEDAPYYYVGIIDRDGNVTAFLINAETGKILAKRQS